MDADFPSNSHINRAPKPKRPEIPEERPTMKPVVSDDQHVIRRKKSLGRRMFDTFFAGDGVIQYVGKNVVLPAVQDLVLDTMRQAMERAILGDRAPTHNSSYRGPIRGSHVSYNRPTTVVTSNSPQPAARRPNMQPSSYDVGEIIVPDRIVASAISDQMFEYLETYGSVSVANLNEALRETSTPTDYRWGWTDLSGLNIRRHREGYAMLFPPPEDLR